MQNVSKIIYSPRRARKTQNTVSFHANETNAIFYFVIAPEILHNFPAFNFMSYLDTSYMLRLISAVHDQKNAGKQRADPTCNHIYATLKIITKNGWT